ncbi:hypothetical protein LWI29_035219 [Acer saccharum]|uniref:Uncharacterized protein n=1 Tax=Acer saccharum TaxID=4024 RepID=A0AA39VZ68_ACESA|nr:hypothetical protein LWI29_035219 [Acer saccharum]
MGGSEMSKSDGLSHRFTKSSIVIYSRLNVTYIKVSCSLQRSDADTCVSWLPQLSFLEQVPVTHAHSRSALASHESPTPTSLSSSRARAAPSTTVSSPTPDFVTPQLPAPAGRSLPPVPTQPAAATPPTSVAAQSCPATFTKKPFAYFCGDCYKTTSWVEAYSGNIFPVGHPSEWTIPEDVRSRVVYPPPFRAQAGRPKNKRFKSAGEHRNGKTRNCTICGKCSHNLNFFWNAQPCQIPIPSATSK